jgi:hypothetical protein
MSVAVLLSCDGTPAVRPSIPLERCRAFLTLPINPAEAADKANAAGWLKSPAGALCPGCARAYQESHP